LKTNYEHTHAGPRCIGLATPLVIAGERTASGAVSAESNRWLQESLAELLAGLSMPRDQ
jgi:hypothetical protein